MYPPASHTTDELPPPPRVRAMRALCPVNEFAAQSSLNKTANRRQPSFLIDFPLNEVELLYPGVMDETLRQHYPSQEPAQLQPVIRRDLGYSHPLTREEQDLHNQVETPYDCGPPVYSEQRKRVVNPFKQPSVYSTLPQLCLEQHAKSNSTSSIYYLPQTKPVTYELIVGTSILIFSQITTKGDQLPPAPTPPQHVQNIFSLFEEANYLPQGQLPDPIVNVGQIEQFIKHIFDTGQFQSETVLVTLIFLNRFLSRTGIPLHHGNWKILYMMALILSQKVCDDTPLINKDFGIIYPPLQINSINKLELIMLDFIEFDLFVDRASFNHLLLQLRYVSRHGKHRRTLVREQSQQFVTFSQKSTRFQDYDFYTYIEQHRFYVNQQEIENRSALHTGQRSTPFEGVAPILNRHVAKRIHYTDVYSLRRQHWKKIVMTAELLALPDHYKVLC